MTPPTDDGLQRTRTTLSWRRTVASAAACAALLVHHVVLDARGWGTAVPLIAAVTGPVALCVAAHARSRLEQATPALIVLTATAVVLFVALSLAASVRLPA